MDVSAFLKPAYYRANGRDRRRHARLRIHGEGALERLPQGGVPGLAAPARATARRDRRAEPGCRRRGGAPIRLRAVDDRLARHRHGRANRAVRQRRPELAPCRADDRRRRSRQARPLREAARADGRREPRRVAPRRRDRRQASVRVQLPLRARGAARTRTDRRGRARRDPPLPRPLPAGLGRRPDARHLALRSGPGRIRRARRPRHPRDRPGALPRRRVQFRRRPREDLRDAVAKSTTRSRRPSSSRAARSGRSSRRASRSDGGTRFSGRSTARAARSTSTWSA